MVNMGSDVYHSVRGKFWRLRRIDYERDVIRQQKRSAWVEGFVVGIMVGGAAIYGLIQFWGG